MLYMVGSMDIHLKMMKKTRSGNLSDLQNKRQVSNPSECLALCLESSITIKKARSYVEPFLFS